MDDYCAAFEGITVCRFFAAGQQQGCRGYMKRSDKVSHHCAHWVPLGDGDFRCDNPNAQAAAIDEFKKTHMEPT